VGLQWASIVGVGLTNLDNKNRASNGSAHGFSRYVINEQQQKGFSRILSDLSTKFNPFTVSAHTIQDRFDQATTLVSHTKCNPVLHFDAGSKFVPIQNIYEKIYSTDLSTWISPPHPAAYADEAIDPQILDD
jgi:hypothetical protein